MRLGFGNEHDHHVRWTVVCVCDRLFEDFLGYPARGLTDEISNAPMIKFNATFWDGTPQSKKVVLFDVLGVNDVVLEQRVLKLFVTGSRVRGRRFNVDKFWIVEVAIQQDQVQSVEFVFLGHGWERRRMTGRATHWVL